MKKYTTPITEMLGSFCSDDQIRTADFFSLSGEIEKINARPSGNAGELDFNDLR